MNEVWGHTDDSNRLDMGLRRGSNVYIPEQWCEWIEGEEEKSIRHSMPRVRVCVVDEGEIT